MNPSSFPQEMNRANKHAPIDFQLNLTHFHFLTVLRPVDNPFFRVYKL